jgi:head-tail adaptor
MWDGGAGQLKAAQRERVTWEAAMSLNAFSSSLVGIVAVRYRGRIMSLSQTHSARQILDVVPRSDAKLTRSFQDVLECEAWPNRQTR